MTGKLHHRYGGSTAANWLHCPGWRALVDACPEKPSSRFADEGTLAHDWAAWLLETSLETGVREPASKYVGSVLDAKLTTRILTAEMAQAIQVYLEAVWEEIDRSKDAKVYIEKDVKLRSEADAGGTPDCYIYHPPLKRLAVFDYKHGEGVFVPVTDNLQIKDYTLCILDSHTGWDVEEIEHVIVQPRSKDSDQPVRRVTWVEAGDGKTTIADFRDWVNTALELSENVCSGKDKPTYCVGDWCRWCAAAPWCPAKQAEALRGFEGLVIDDEIDADKTPLPAHLSDEQLAAIVDRLEALVAYANQCQQILEARLLEGNPVPGWKVVDKKGRRSWISDQKRVCADLGILYDITEDEASPRKLRPFTEIEPLLKSYGASKKEIEAFKNAHTRKDSSGQTIARESDPRPAVNAAERSFGSVDTSGFDEND